MSLSLFVHPAYELLLPLHNSRQQPAVSRSRGPAWSSLNQVASSVCVAPCPTQAVSLQHVEVEKEQRGRATTGVDLQQVRSGAVLCPHTTMQYDVISVQSISDRIVVANHGMIMRPAAAAVAHCVMVVIGGLCDGCTLLLCHSLFSTVLKYEVW